MPDSALLTAVTAQTARSTELMDYFQNARDNIDLSLATFETSHVETATIITVGPSGKDYTDIQLAWDSLKGKLLKAPVTIQVDDGIHISPRLIFEGITQSSLINIQGNLSSPENCVLVFTGSGVIAEKYTNVKFSGFTLRGPIATERGIWVRENASVYSEPGTLIIENFLNSVLCEQTGTVLIEGVKLTDFTSSGIFNLGNTLAKNSTITGASRTEGYGVLCIDTGYADVSYSNISQIKDAIFSGNGATVVLNYSVVSDTDLAIRSTDSSFVAASYCNVSNCLYAFTAYKNSSITCVGTVADGCTNIGYRASDSSSINAANSTATNCLGNGYHPSYSSYINAGSTTVSGNGTDYSLPSDIAGNIGSYVTY